MASLGDYVFLTLVLAIIVAIVYALKPGQQGVQSLKHSQQALKNNGINLSSTGLSVKTDRRAMSQQEGNARGSPIYVRLSLPGKQ